ncbi:hypothetical protein [Fictibacillus sp. JL2B1089]
MSCQEIIEAQKNVEEMINIHNEISKIREERRLRDKEILDGILSLLKVK